MTRVVLDASAVIALILDEPGAEVVAQAVPDSAITSVNLAEVIGHLARSGLRESDVRKLIEPLAIERIGFDEDSAYRAGMMVPVTRSAALSLGDRACLALAQHLDVPALTADRRWLSLASAVGVRGHPDSAIAHAAA